MAATSSYQWLFIYLSFWAMATCKVFHSGSHCLESLDKREQQQWLLFPDAASCENIFGDHIVLWKIPNNHRRILV